VLHVKNLPSFDETMSQEDAEQLLTALTVPYLRCVSFAVFCSFCVPHVLDCVTVCVCVCVLCFFRVLGHIPI